jgi:EAL and modified HD-GYP domain-containing signal transduction protein
MIYLTSPSDGIKQIMHNSSTDILLASQPIYDRSRELFGCELLFRNAEQLTAKEVGDDRATSQVLVNYCTSVVEQADVIQRPVFINISETMLLSGAFFPIAPEKVVLELLETIQVTPQVVAAVIDWQKAGFQFALDDFDFSPAWDDLLPLAKYVKIDVLQGSSGDMCAKRREYAHKNQLWVAEKVETEEVFNAYRDCGFDLFQGYFLAKPKLVLGKAIKSGQAGALEVLQAVNDDNIKVEKLAEVISRNPRLAMQLLKIVNSPACSLNREVQSIRETIVFLGISQVRKWAIILSLLSASDSGLQVCRLILRNVREITSRYADFMSKTSCVR